MPCCADSGNPLTDARCDLEDHSTFYLGGFWAGDEPCGNGISQIRWDVTLDAGKGIDLEYRWHYFWRG